MRDCWNATEFDSTEDFGCPSDCGTASVSTEELRQLQALARRLATTRVAADPSRQLTLRRQLLNGPALGRRRFVWSPLACGRALPLLLRRQAAFAVVATVLLSLPLLLATPGVAAFTQGLRQQVGDLIIIDHPGPERHVPQPTAAVAANPAPPEILTPGEALLRYGFVIAQPTYMPDGYHQVMQIIIRQGDGGRLAISEYDGDDAGGRLTMGQSTIIRERGRELPVGDANFGSVTIRGLKALWVERQPLTGYRDDEGPVLPVRYLLWEEDGYLFRLEGTNLTLAELCRVAEALAK